MGRKNGDIRKWKERMGDVMSVGIIHKSLVELDFI